MINVLIFTLSTLFIPNNVNQSGIIVDCNGKAIENVHVYTENNLTETFSDNKGSYSIKDAGEDSDSTILYFEAIGYEPVELKVKAGQIQKITLYEKAVNIDEVIVKSDRHGRISNYAAQKVEINPFEVYTSPTAFGDILGALKIIPGAQSPGNDGRLYVRGGNSEESKTFIDGMMIYNPYTLSQKNVSVRGRFSPNLFQGISLQSGGYGSEFGQALSGLLSLNTKDKLDSKIDINISSTGVEAAVVKLQQQSQISLGINYTNMRPYGQVFKDDYTWKKYYEDISGNFLGIFNLSKRLNAKTQLSFSKSLVDYGHRNIDSILFNNDISETYVWGQTTWHYDFSKNSRLFLGSNITIDQFKGTDVSIQGDSVETNVIFSHHKIFYELKKKKLTYTAGVEAFYSRFDQNYRFITDYSSDINDLVLSNFYQVTFFPIDRTCLTFGVRTEYASAIDKYNLAPRLYASHKFNDNHILSFSAGSYFQNPGNDYLKLDKKLSFIKSNNVTLTYAYAKNRSKFQVDSYYKQYVNLITYDDYGLFHTHLGNNGDGYAYGTDVFLKGFVDMLEYWVSYSYIDSERLQQSYSQRRMPDLISGHSFKFDLKYWLSPIRSLLGAGYHIESGTYGEVMINGHKTTMKTPFRNSLTLNLSYLPFNNTIIHFSCQNVLGSNNIYGYTGSAYLNKYKAETTPSKRFYYIALLLSFNASKINNQLNSL